MIWLFLFPLLTIIALQADSSANKKHYMIFRILLVLIISSIVAFGSIVCEDNGLYADFYDSLNLSDFKKTDISLTKSYNNRYEIGYLLLNYIAKVFRLGVPGFFFLIAVLVNGLFISFIYKYKNAALTIIYLVLSGICIQQGNLVRQFIAAAVFAYSIKYVIDRNWIKYIICVIIALAFHSSSVLLLAFLPLCFINFNNEINDKRLLIVLLGIYGVSILVMLGILSLPLLEYASLLVAYEDYMTDSNTVGMEFSVFRVILLNLMAVYIFFTQVKKNPVLSSVLIIEAVLTNLSVSFPNLTRLYVLFDVVSVTFFFHSLQLTDIKMSHSRFQLGAFAKFFFIFYCCVMLVKDYIFNDNVLLLSETYSISDFFKF